jgi:hypothetical protein
MASAFSRLLHRHRAIFSLSVSVCSIAVVNTERPDGSLLSERESGSESLDKFQRGTTIGRLNRSDPGSLPPTTKVLVVIGITGAGKSSTSNTLAGRTHAPFALSSSLTSVTSAVSYRDYSFLGESYRVIDTPGLSDTSRDAAEIAEELSRFASFAPHGISAFLLCVPHGRFTLEQEAALRRLLDLFGPAVKQHAVLVFTSAVQETPERTLLTRDELLEQINQLPTRHFLRQLVLELKYRVVPVENHLDPHKQISRFQLHQRIADVLRDNGGRTYDPSHFSVVSADAAAHPLTMAHPLLRDLHHAIHGPCKASVERRTTDQQLVLRVDCPLQLPEP